MIKTNRTPGFSFVVRCHNEEKTIEQCITSLKGLKHPYEIIVVLHRCSDSSEEIVNKLKDSNPITVVSYDKKISRAGFETLITPSNHENSLVSYYEFCFSHASFRWIFKWDADFSATQGLLDFLNNLDSAEESKLVYRIKCDLDSYTTSEFYLSNCLVGFSKFIFWEIPSYEKDNHTTAQAPDTAIIKSLPRKNLKSYWNNFPWFEQPDTFDKELYEKKKVLESLVGKEPPGLGACCFWGENDKEYVSLWYKIKDLEKELNKHNISFYW